ncbi:MAG: hypothetical protein M1826_003108 [Phylliscum demangeonii]|nr:MAG: hypothetical protein M1826_003108 [Phylliscum demangeonii]
MSETLLSSLCGEDAWYWLYTSNTIKFNPNGTGEIVSRYELVIWIAAEFERKSLSPKSLDQVVDVSGIGATRKHPQPISQFDIELTLAKRIIPRMRGPETQTRRINESLLTDDVFLPKTYTVRLEKGNFLAPCDAMFPEHEDQYTPRFALRLVFDQSPYPPRHEWKDPSGGPDAMKMWEWKEFCARESADLTKRADRHAWWRNCVVS